MLEGVGVVLLRCTAGAKEHCLEEARSAWAKRGADRHGWLHGNAAWFGPRRQALLWGPANLFSCFATPS